MAEALVIGRRGLAHDLVVHVLMACGVPLVNRHDHHALSEVDIVVVLVDPEPEHWDVAGALNAPVVLITHYDLDDDEVVAAVGRGAEAVLHTDASPERVLHAIDVASTGGTLLTPRQARALARAVRTQPVADAAPVRLTTREQDILRSIDRGESVKQTARVLGISIKTVENLQSRLFRKLDARNRAQAVARAHAFGLLEPSVPGDEAFPQSPLGGTTVWDPSPSFRSLGVS
jgi:DNA-binding NarL/FixJ family response regulator